MKSSLNGDDASAFHDYRIMNLRKLYPYIPESLNRVLLKFSVGATSYYETMQQVANDLGEALDDMSG